MGRKPLPDDQRRNRWRVYVTNAERQYLEDALEEYRTIKTRVLKALEATDGQHNPGT